MAPSAPRTHAAAAIRMKQIALDNQSHTIRRLRAQLAPQYESLSMSKKIERMMAKKQRARESHVVCHQKFQTRIQEAEDSMQAQHLIIEALSVSQSQQGSAGSSSQRPQLFVQSQQLGFQPREPSRFGGSTRPQFPGPQQAQVNALTREQADDRPEGVIAVRISTSYISPSSTSEGSTRRFDLTTACTDPIPQPAAASCRFRHLNYAQQLTSSFDNSFLATEYINTATGNLCVATESPVASTAEISMQSIPAESLSQEQNAVVSTYVNDIVLLSLTPNSICWLHCSLRLNISSTTSLPLASGCKLPADSCVWMTSPMTSSTTNPSAESQHDVASSFALRFSTRSVLGKCVYLVTLAMSLFDLQDVCIAIGSIATLDLPMVVDLIGIYGLKGPYCTLNTTNWFLQALSVIPRGSWGDVARRFTMIRWASPEL
ncbi:hypothetical protein F511_24265 [Dorcoceras hygrometricum]|uniref:Uncharacterized protein n=1 Tax=Dorcoceras hygrometricum TaxID=472368 RepID=A0A2Z7ATR6_9LAMI|nr:hypothetical protein F511_24265 [Dorcoceras hygrometricum]